MPAIDVDLKFGSQRPAPLENGTAYRPRLTP